MKTQMLFFALSCLCIAGAGCSSIHTTHVKRNEDRCGWDTKHLRGIPITLEVPHQYQVQVVERYYITGGADATKLPKLLKVGNETIKTTYVKLDVTTTKEVFTVDFVKPGAGVLTTKADLDPTNQYFTKIDNSIEDKTIDAIKEAITKVAGALPPVAKGKSTGLMAPGADANVTPLEKVIAVGVFSVNDSQAKEKIHDFLCRHLNGCSSSVCTVAGHGMAPVVEFVPPPKK